MLVSENGCSGNESETGYDESSQDWNEEIGSLLDDDVALSESSNVQPIQDKEGVTDDLERTNSESVNNQRNKEGKKTHRRKHLQHHLSWQNALKKAQCMPDPWEKFHIDDSCPTEVAIRHRYNALKKNWVKDEVRIKMEALVSFRLLLFLLCLYIVCGCKASASHNFIQHNNSLMLHCSLCTCNFMCH